MKTKIEIEQKITTITNTIQQNYPELSEYIIDIPVNSSESEESTIKSLEDYYHSLKELINNYNNTDKKTKSKDDDDSSKYPGYPSYPHSKDIYQQNKKESEMNPEDLSKTKKIDKEENSMNEKKFQNHMSGDDLDVPGAELDDLQESIGSEDEENNYYSLGGDNHSNLAEDNR